MNNAFATPQLGRTMPFGWQCAPLGSVCRIVSGSTPRVELKGYWHGDIVWITPTDLGKLDERYIRDSERRITAEGYNSCGTEVVPANSVVMSSRAPIGHIGIAQVPLCTNQGCKSFIPEAWIDPDFLYFALKHAVPQLQALGSGATFAEVSKGQLERFEITFPPFSEQKRIAAILTEQLGIAKLTYNAATAQVKAAKELPVAYLRTVFDSPEARKWPRTCVADLLRAPLKTGISKPTLPNAGKHCLTLSSVRNGGLDLTASKPVDVSDSEAARNWVRPSVFYVVRGNGNRSLVGRGAFAPAVIPSPVLYPDLLIEVDTRPELVHPRYLRWVWDSAEVRQDIEAKARTSAGIYKINQANLARVALPMPAVSEQQCIAKRLDEQTVHEQKIQRSLVEQLAMVNKLAPALLYRAFTGEL